MAVYKGDTEDEVNATNAYNQAMQTLAESSVPLSAGGDYAATIRKNWPVGQMQFARGGYAGKGFVKPVAGAVEEAIAAAKKLMTREPVPQQVVVDPVERAANLARFMENAKTPPVLYHASHADIPEFKNTKGSHLGFHFGDVEAANTRLEDTAGKFPFPKADLDERRAIVDAHAKNLYAYEDALRRKNTEVPIDELAKALEAGEDIGPIFKKYEYVPTPEEQAQLNQLRQTYESSQTPIIQPGGVGANIGAYHVGITNPLRLPDVGNWGSVKGIKEHLPFETEARTQAELLSELKGRGYDGIVYQNNVETPIMKTDSYIAFDPEQIKSAIGNAGTFDPTRARVNEAYGGSVGYARGGYATEGYVDDPQSARNILQPADVKEWNYPTWIESLRDYLAEKGPQTGTGRPTLGGERVANGVRTVLQALPVSGQIDAAQRSLRSGEHGDYAEAGLDLLGMLPTASIYRSMAREVSPALRAASTAMVTAPALSEMGRTEYLDAPQTITRQELDSVPVFLAAQRSGQKRGMELPYRTAYEDGGMVDDVLHALRLASSQHSRKGYADGRAVKSLAGSSNEIGEAIATALKTLKGSVVSSPSVAKTTAKPARQFPELAERYPLVLPGRPAIDAVTGKEYIAKDLSDEAKAVAQARAIAQKEIKAGNFDPYFPPENRQPVDKGLFPQYDFDTTQLVASRPETFAKYDAIANDPRAEQSLIQMMLKGKESEETASGWYHMNQLLEKYIEVYGPEIGPDKFRTNFAESMAATTGGMSPTNNFMLAHYGNFNANQTPWPSNSPQELSLGAYDMPYPIAAGKMGLRNNADAFNKMVLGEAGITPDNPKRFDFAGNFLGQDRAVMDEQMMGGSFGKIDPKLAGAPPAKMYGHFANKVNEIGQDLGMSPSNAQELGWFGAKAFKNPGKDITPQPMIDDVNQAIERTHRITGLPHDEIVERGVVKQEIPLYAHGGAVEHALRLARGGYADGGIPMPNFAPQGPAIDIYSQVPGAGSFSFNPAKPTTVDNIPSGQQGPSSMFSPYTPTPAAEPAPAPVDEAGSAYQPEGGGGESGNSDAGNASGTDSSSYSSEGPGGTGMEARGGRIWPKNNTGDNAVRLAHLIHHEMRSDPLFERKIQSILSRL